MPRTTPQTWIRAWAPAVIWAWVIWQLGSDGLNETDTRSLLGQWLERFLPPLSAENLASLVWFLRTLAHPAIYALLALLCWRAARLTFELSARQIGLFGILPVLLLAICDESRQAASQMRSGTWNDVFLDLAGGALTLIALGVWEARRGQPLFVRPPTAAE